MRTPSSGAKMTATNQDTMRAIADDGEQREGVLAGRACGETDGNKSGDGDERAGQHGERHRFGKRTLRRRRCHRPARAC